MSTNNQTFAAATGIKDNREAAANERYTQLHTRALRHTLNGDDSAAERAGEQARKLAHAESYRGNLAPLLDLLTRHYA